MSLAYLTAEAARDRLILMGKYTAETAPSLELLELGLSDLEIVVDGWAGYRIAPTQYTERLTTNAKGEAIMTYYPVLSVENLMSFQDHAVGISPLPIPKVQIASIWRQNRRLFFNVRNVPFEVTYVAGIDPLPREVTQAVWSLLLKVIEERALGGDLNFLNTADREVASISIPGGLSKSFRYPTSSSSGNSNRQQPQTVLDKILMGIDKYRRRTITTN
jgi:hypothetical protein